MRDQDEMECVICRGEVEARMTEYAYDDARSLPVWFCKICGHTMPVTAWNSGLWLRDICVE